MKLTSEEIDAWAPTEFNLSDETRYTTLEDQLKAFRSEFRKEFRLEVAACVQRALASVRPDSGLIDLFLSASDSDTLAEFCGVASDLAVDVPRFQADASYRDGVLAAWSHAKASIELTINDVQVAMEREANK